MVSLADLHMHTTASDGTLSPQALVNEVLLRQMLMPEPKLRVIAVTDHDSFPREIKIDHGPEAFFRDAERDRHQVIDRPA